MRGILKRMAWVFLVALSVVLPGCLDTDQPLSDPAKSRPDQALLGVWQSTTNPNEYIFVGVSPDKEAPAGVMRVVRTGFKRQDQTISSHSYFDFTVTPVGGTNIANLLLGSKSDTTWADWLKDDGRACQIIRYDIAGDALSVWEEASSDGESKAVDAGKIRSAKPGSTQRDAASVLDYLKNGGVAALFPEGSKELYKRVTK